MTPEEIQGARRLRDLGTAFWGSRALLSAVEIGLFPVLADGPADEVAIRDKLGLHERAARPLLEALVGLGLLESVAGRYRNAPVASRHLVPGRPGYLGAYLARCARQFPLWSRLTETLRTGRTQIPGVPDEVNHFTVMYDDPELLRSFMAGMDGLTALISDELMTAVDWDGCETFVDVGGARGRLAADLVRAHPHLRGTVFDLPQVLPVFAELAGREGVADRVAFHGGDFFADSLPSADVLVFGHVLHDWDDERCRMLVAKAYRALPPGGQIVVYDMMLGGSDDRYARLLSLSMILVSTHGSEHSVETYRGWLLDAGFTGVTTRPLGDTETLMTARKE